MKIKISPLSKTYLIPMKCTNTIVESFCKVDWQKKATIQKHTQKMDKYYSMPPIFQFLHIIWSFDIGL